MGIIKLEDVLGWDTKTGFCRTDCEPDPDVGATPIERGPYSPAEDIITCDTCNARLV